MKEKWIRWILILSIFIVYIVISLFKKDSEQLTFGVALLLGGVLGLLINIKT